MKPRNTPRGRRVGTGFLLAAALAFAVGAWGDPLATDGKTAFKKGGATSDTARFVADPSDHINSIVAGGEKAFISLTPMYLNANGDPYNQAATGAGYTDANISGNTLTVDAGGFRAFFNVEAGAWDSTRGGGVYVRSEAGRVDSKSFQGANAVPANPGCDILQLSDPSIEIPCANTLECIAEFNSVGPPKCGDAVVGICNWGWINTSKAPHADGKQWIHANKFGSVVVYWDLTEATGPRWFSSAEPSEARVDDKYPAPYYIASLALWVPECAKGTYTLDFVADETFLADWTGVRLPDLGVPVNLRPAVIDVPDGACCDGTTGLCEDYVSPGDCANVNPEDQFTWYRYELCANVPCPQHTGACCDQTAIIGTCSDNVLSDGCVCDKCGWHKDTPCEEIECVRDPIPTVSSWGLAILALLLLTGAKIYFGRRQPATE